MEVRGLGLSVVSFRPRFCAIGFLVGGWYVVALACARRVGTSTFLFYWGSIALDVADLVCFSSLTLLSPLLKS